MRDCQMMKEKTKCRPETFPTEQGVTTKPLGDSSSRFRGLRMTSVFLKAGGVFILVTVILGLMLSGCSGKGSKASGEKIRGYANELYNRELYVQAVREYENYLNFYKADDSEKANITFTIANIYFERLHDYENALANYLRIKHLFPEKNLATQVDQQIVACLERLNRSSDAKQALDEATAIDQSKVQSSRPGKIIARIGNRPITNEDLKFQLNQLPDYMKDQFKDKKQKLEFLRNYIATELFYDAAKRKGLDNDKDVVEGAFQTKKNLMVQKYLQEEIVPRIKISTGDLQLYYKANLDKYTEKDVKGKVKRQKPFEEVQKPVSENYIREKQQQAVQELLGRMMTAEKVEVYDDLVD
jgi:tetratricopeptide (TPR) repeat protein